MKVSQDGVEAIMLREGVELTAYRDERGITTVGVGHTAAAGSPIPEMGMTITTAEALSILADDLAPIEAVLSSWIKVPVTQNEFDACCSLTFNIGLGGFQGSSVLRQLNMGNYGQAARDFLMWDIPTDLLTRRQGEMAQFLRPDVPTPPAPVPASGPWSIQQIQMALNKWLSTLTAAMHTPLAVDGDWGPKSKSAVMEFQRRHGLTVDGIVGPVTMAALQAA